MSPSLRAFVRVTLVSATVMLNSAAVMLISAAALGLSPSGAVAGGAPSAPMMVDPTISAWLTEVSPDTMAAWDQKLVGYVTRHTNSDTVSSTVGIGAARRWVHSKFQDFSSQNGGALEPSYFDFTATICSQTKSHRNVLATLPGQLTPERIFMMGGHLDSRNVDLCNSTIGSPGANDDATGVIAAMEIARIITSSSFDATIAFQAFTSEEQSLTGSTAYATWARDQGLQIVGMLNNDIIGNINGCPDSPSCGGGQPTDADSTSVRCYSGGPSTSASRQLSRLSKRVAEAYAPEMTMHLYPMIDRAGRGGDHISFYNAGYPSVRFIETLEFTGRQHNSLDLIQFMNFEYMARNVRINLALVANLAQAPPTPTGIEVFDVGDGSSVFTRWSPVTGTPDLAGYRVAWRNSVSGDTLFYSDVLDAGASTEFTITGLTPEVEIFVSVGAYDTGGHESIYSTERLVTPGVAPHMPKLFSVSSSASQIQLSWAPPQEQDLVRHRIFRSLEPVNNFAQVDSVGPNVTNWLDPSAAPGLFYYYKLQSVDVTALASPFTAVDKGRLYQPQNGLLLVDASKDGGGGLGNPTDLEVDNYYETLLAGFPILDRWDWNTQLTNGVILTDADMGRYRAVVIHCDRTAGTIKADSTEIRQYVASGGRVWISGWELRKSLGNGVSATQYFAPGRFMHDVCHVDTVRTAGNTENDYIGSDPLSIEYPALTVDTAKWPFNSGKLNTMDAFPGGPLFPEQSVSIYTYNSSLGAGGPNHGRVNGLKYPAVSPKFFLTDFPLYFMNGTASRNLTVQIMHEFGFGTSAVDESIPSTALLLAPSRPNPFSRTTTLRFRLPSAERVELRIVDVSGRVVRRLLNEARQPGWNSIEWDGRDDRGRAVRSGVYFSVLESTSASTSGSGSATKSASGRAPAGRKQRAVRSLTILR